MQDFRLRIVVLFLLATFCICFEAKAQTPYRRYAPPAGPTITPYLNYFRRDVGAVGDPYNAFIVPRRQLDAQVYQLNQQQQTDFQTNQRQIRQMRETTAVPTGTGAGFMFFSHYYPQPGQVSKGKRR